MSFDDSHIRAARRGVALAAERMSLAGERGAAVAAKAIVGTVSVSSRRGSDIVSRETIVSTAKGIREVTPERVSKIIEATVHRATLRVREPVAVRLNRNVKCKSGSADDRWDVSEASQGRVLTGSAMYELSGVESRIIEIRRTLESVMLVRKDFRAISSELYRLEKRREALLNRKA